MPAFAATSISFTGGPGTLSSGSSTFSALAPDGSTITATVTAWNATMATTGANAGKYVISAASLGRYADGLGVTATTLNGSGGTVSVDSPSVSGCGTAGSCGAQQIDNVGNTAGSSSFDFLQISFNQAVTFNSFTRSTSGIANGTTSLLGLPNYDYDDDFSYGSGAAITNGLALSSLAALFQTNVGTNGQCGSILNGLTGCTDTSTLTGDAAAQNWYLGANIGTNYGDSYIDSFKAQSLTVTQGTASAVPEASTWTMMILGFGGIGAIVRRRRSGLMHLLTN